MATDGEAERRLREGHAVFPDDLVAATVIRRRRWLYRSTWAMLVLLLGAAVLDGVGAVDVYGVEDAAVTDRGDGVELEVRYPSTSRPALASPFRITVRRDGGWSDGETVRIGVRRNYLEAWDLNGILPAPSAETNGEDADMIVWEFDPPGGDELVVTYESRIEPGVQSARRGWVAVLDGDDAELARVSFRTVVRP